MSRALLLNIRGQCATGLAIVEAARRSVSVPTRCRDLHDSERQKHSPAANCHGVSCAFRGSAAVVMRTIGVEPAGTGMVWLRVLAQLTTTVSS